MDLTDVVIADDEKKCRPPPSYDDAVDDIKGACGGSSSMTSSEIARLEKKKKKLNNSMLQLERMTSKTELMEAYDAEISPNLKSDEPMYMEINDIIIDKDKSSKNEKASSNENSIAFKKTAHNDKVAAARKSSTHI